MEITLNIPDVFAAPLSAHGEGLEAQLIRDAAIGAYCRDAISRYELQQTLGLESHYELDGLLKELGVMHNAYSGQDLLDDLATIGFYDSDKKTP